MADRRLAAGLTRAELARVVATLSPLLVGAQVQKARQPRQTALVLECRAPGKSLAVLFSVHAKFPRLVPLRNSLSENITAGPFCMLVRKRLVGGRIIELAIDPADRIATLSVNQLDEDGAEAVWTLVAELIGPKGNLLLLDPTGRVVEALLPKRLASRRLSPGDLYEPPPRPATNANEDRGLSVDELADQIERAERQFEFEASVARLAGVLARERKRLRKYLEKQRGEFANLPHAETLTRQAETLLAYLHLAKKGQTNVSLPNLYEADGAALVVPLDPAKSPKENAEAMFKTARRSRRKGEGLRARIAEMEAQEQKLTAIAAEIERATDLAGMARVEERMRAGGIKLAEERERQPAKAEKAKKSGAQPFVAADGAHIFVGRNARENEELTFHVARGNDYWLHTEGAAGSHVIIKLPPNGELSSETLLDAASLAVLHSSIKSAGGGSVIYTRCKNVRRPKNAPTGQVYAGSTRSIFIRLDEQRLARLYASRE